MDASVELPLIYSMARSASTLLEFIQHYCGSLRMAYLLGVIGMIDTPV